MKILKAGTLVFTPKEVILIGFEFDNSRPVTDLGNGFCRIDLTMKDMKVILGHPRLKVVVSASEVTE